MVIASNAVSSVFVGAHLVKRVVVSAPSSWSNLKVRVAMFWCADVRLRKNRDGGEDVRRPILNFKRDNAIVDGMRIFATYCCLQWVPSFFSDA